MSCQWRAQCKVAGIRTIEKHLCFPQNKLIIFQGGSTRRAQPCKLMSESGKHELGRTNWFTKQNMKVSFPPCVYRSAVGRRAALGSKQSLPGPNHQVVPLRAEPQLSLASSVAREFRRHKAILTTSLKLCFSL